MVLRLPLDEHYLIPNPGPPPPSGGNGDPLDGLGDGVDGRAALAGLADYSHVWLLWAAHRVGRAVINNTRERASHPASVLAAAPWPRPEGDAAAGRARAEVGVSVVSSLVKPGRETREEEPDPEDLDYIDLEAGRVASRRQSFSEVLHQMETMSISGNGSLNGHKDSRKASSGPRIPKSPTTNFSFIDNSVMNIRVGDRVYKVDGNRRQNLIETSPEFETAISLESMQSGHGGSSTWDSPSSGSGKAPTPEFTTSDIINIDDELDLVETEDGYVPASSLPSSDISQGGKRVTIRSPSRGQRPTSLSLSSQRSRHSFSSASSTWCGASRQKSASCGAVLRRTGGIPCHSKRPGEWHGLPGAPHGKPFGVS